MMTVLLVLTPLGNPFRLVVLDGGLMVVLIGLIASYALLTEILKSRMTLLFHTNPQSAVQR
jgi:hypothetical protein